MLFNRLGTRHWTPGGTLLRIGIGVAVAWLVLRALGIIWPSDAMSSSEWPKTDFTRTTVDPAEIRSGGPPRDGIPSLDDPKFVPVAKAAEWLHPREPVIVASVGDDSRAYPLQILIWHEIVNDEVGGQPISVTFCPLCNASIIFDRRHAGQVLDFGTTGRLRMSDMVMYDRQTETWWQQFSGEGIIGKFAGDTLNQLPTRIVAFEDFLEAHADGTVLSKETGYRRDYGRNPYQGYDRIGNSPFLYDDPVDPRLPAMERVLAVSIDEKHRLYPFSALDNRPVVNDVFRGQQIVVLAKQGSLSVLDTARISDGRKVPAANAFSRDLSGQRLEFESAANGTIVDRQTGSTWNILGECVAGELKGRELRPLNGGVHFAFAWLAFRPDSEIFGTD